MVSGCGAKTGLLLPDVEVGVDATLDAPDVTDTPDGTDVSDACVSPLQPVESLVVETVFVIDRSASMTELTPSGIRRWDALTSAMTRVLPAVERNLWMGLLQYPEVPTGSAPACRLRGERALTPESLALAMSTLEITPQSFNTGALLSAVRATNPIGGTPTWKALTVASNYYRNNPQSNHVRGRYLVLATDGGPNCNSTLSARTCMCTNPRGCGGTLGGFSCLDDERTLSLLRTLNDQGISTFVIGAPGQDNTTVFLEPTLNAMAVAGGRPRDPAPGQPRYYPATDVGDFVTALQDITNQLVRCRYVTNPLRDPSRATVVVGGVDVARDPTHRQGWDWARADAGELVIYGAACDRAQSNQTVRVRVECSTPP